MLFKKLHKKLEAPGKDTENDASEINELNEDDETLLEEQYQKSLKKRNWIYRIRKVILILIVGIGLLGGYRSLADQGQEIIVSKAINDYAFAEQYLQYYFQYPQTEQSSEYLQIFSIGTWSSDYETNVKKVVSVDTKIYQVITNDTEESDGGITIYAKMKLRVEYSDDTEKIQEIYTSLNAVQQNDKYVVTSPITMESSDFISMTDDEKNEYQKDMTEMEGQDLNDEEKEEMKNTIQLFLTTYATDLEQARLLMQNAADLKPLDPDTKITFVNLGTASQTDTECTVIADVTFETGKFLKQNRSIRFTFDRKTNKITQMEVY